MTKGCVVRLVLDLLASPDVEWAWRVRLWPQLASIPGDIAEQLTIDARYEGYLSRQRQDIAAYRRDEALELPVDLDYGAIGGLSNEDRQKLGAHRPPTCGPAARTSRMTPPALARLLKHVRRPAA